MTPAVAKARAAVERFKQNFRRTRASEPQAVVDAADVLTVRLMELSTDEYTLNNPQNRKRVVEGLDAFEAARASDQQAWR